MKKNLFTIAQWLLVVLGSIFMGTRVLPKLYIIATTDPPYLYMKQDLAELSVCAREAGFEFDPPMLRVMKPAYVWGRPHGYAEVWSNVVLLAPYASYETIAHELGHIIDYQMGQKGHPLFERYRKSPKLSQEVADAIRDVILDTCSTSR